MRRRSRASCYGDPRPRGEIPIFRDSLISRGTKSGTEGPASWAHVIGCEAKQKLRVRLARENKNPGSPVGSAPEMRACREASAMLRRALASRSSEAAIISTRVSRLAARFPRPLRRRRRRCRRRRARAAALLLHDDLRRTSRRRRRVGDGRGARAARADRAKTAVLRVGSRVPRRTVPDPARTR